MSLTHLSVSVLSHLFWTCALLTALIGVDLMFFCASRKHFIVGWLVLFLAVVGLVAFHLSDNYTGVGINEATWYHLRYGREGLTWGLVMPIVQTALVAILAVVAAGVVAWKFMKRRALAEPVARSEWWLAAYVLVLVLCPGWVQAVGLVDLALSRDTHRQDLVRQMTLVDSLPSATGTPKSVVYIYGESLEGVFLDQQEFPGLTPNLTALSKQGISMEGLRQAPFAGWTIAGIIASQCAFPALGEQEHQKHASSSDMMCLGDLLKARGYTMSYFNGADIKFAGKDLFFRAHGFDQVEGKTELLQRKPGTEVSNWGVHDDDLFQVVEGEFDRLQKQGKPFFLSTLTVDTHPPHGYPGKFCRGFEKYADGSSGMLNAVHCSDKVVSDFVKRIRAKAGGDVLIVIASDHLQSASMSDANRRLEPLGDKRHNLWMVLGKSIAPKTIRREGTTFDVAPTLLPLMGFDIHAMNLGRDLLGKRPTLLEHFGRDGFFDRISSAFARGDDGRWKQDMADPSRKQPDDGK